MDEEIKRGCDRVFEFYKTYWVQETKDTAFDPTSSKFMKLPQEIASLILAAVQYGAVTACGNFSHKSKKLRKEFAYYLTEKLNMPHDKADIVSKTIQQQEKNIAVQNAILMGQEIFRKWSRHQAEEADKKYSEIMARQKK